jgi:hypothetical protein
MKTQEEIEQLAEKYWAKQPYNEDAYVVGYTKCQEDMIKILKEEIKIAFIHGQGNGIMMEAGLERDETEDYVNNRMLSLNKQD